MSKPIAGVAAVSIQDRVERRTLEHTNSRVGDVDGKIDRAPWRTVQDEGDQKPLAQQQACLRKKVGEARRQEGVSDSVWGLVDDSSVVRD